jgi:hypothetical protein
MDCDGHRKDTMHCVFTTNAIIITIIIDFIIRIVIANGIAMGIVETQCK